MKMKRIILPVVCLFLLLSPVFAGEGGGGGKLTKYFSIVIEPSKSIYSPGDTMVLRIVVTDKSTGKPVEGAEVVDNINVYQDGSYQIVAEEKGDGVYIVKQKIETQAKWGGVTNKIKVSKEGKSDEVTRVVTFMKFSPYFYAIGVTICAILAGLVIGTIFGKTAAH